MMGGGGRPGLGGAVTLSKYAMTYLITDDARSIRIHERKRKKRSML